MSYLEHIVKKVRIYNPLTTYFYSKMFFYTWRHYSNLTFDKLSLFEYEKKIYFESSDSEEDKCQIPERFPQNPHPSLNLRPNKFNAFEIPIKNILSPLRTLPNIIITKMD